MSEFKTVAQVRDFVKDQMKEGMLNGLEWYELAKKIHDPTRFYPSTGLVPEQYGVLRFKMMEKYLPSKPRNTEFPPKKDIAVIDQLIMSAYFICKGGHITRIDLADKLSCSVAKAGTLLVFSINAVYHVINDGVLNSDLTIAEIVDLQGIFNELFGSVALTLIADISVLRMEVGGIMKALLLVCDGKLRIRFKQLLDWCSDSLDEEEFLNSDFYKKQVCNEVLKALMFKCENPECMHGDLEALIPWLVCVDCMMDVTGQTYGRTKNVWPPLLKTCNNFKGQVTNTGQTFNEAWEEIRLGIELEPIRMLKTYQFLHKTIPKDRFSDEFLNRIVDLIVFMENAFRNGFFDEPSSESENPGHSSILEQPRHVSVAPEQRVKDPRRMFYKCVLPLHAYEQSTTPKPSYAIRLGGMSNVEKQPIAKITDIVPSGNIEGPDPLADQQTLTKLRDLKRKLND